MRELVAVHGHTVMLCRATCKWLCDQPGAGEEKDCCGWAWTGCWESHTAPFICIVGDEEWKVHATAHSPAHQVLSSTGTACSIFKSCSNGSLNGRASLPASHDRIRDLPARRHSHTVKPSHIARFPNSAQCCLLACQLGAALMSASEPVPHTSLPRPLKPTPQLLECQGPNAPRTRAHPTRSAPGDGKGYHVGSRVLSPRPGSLPPLKAISPGRTAAAGLLQPSVPGGKRVVASPDTTPLSGAEPVSPGGPGEEVDGNSLSRSAKDARTGGWVGG